MTRPARYYSEITLQLENEKPSAGYEDSRANETKNIAILLCVFSKPDRRNLAEGPFGNNLISLVKNVLEMNRVVASSTILLNRLDDIMNPFKMTHFLDEIDIQLVLAASGGHLSDFQRSLKVVSWVKDGREEVARGD